MASMLNLSDILLQEGDNVSSFEELKTTIQRKALETGSIFFQVDIEPPAYNDRPENWHDQLEMAFSDAR
uniref:Sulfur relay protein DsrC n=1 Tax=uncultured Thiotrichaceae bacterium TaxID=298394 RepID=A0A6S6TJJ5_9GAMM|nr:MAG: Unknown protein [uncultured Thiotrichaceae bacterium]